MVVVGSGGCSDGMGKMEVDELRVCDEGVP